MAIETTISKLRAAIDERWRTSVRFRYLFPVAIVLGTIAIIIAIAAFAVYMGHPSTGICFMLFCGGCFLLIRTFLSFRKGVFTVGRFPTFSVYDRREKPIGFWFYTVFFTFLGALIISITVFLAFLPAGDWK